MTMKKIILASATLIFICQFAWAESHTWTFKSGAEFPGEYVSSSTNVLITQRDGRYFSVGISNLSDDDILYIKKRENDASQFAIELSLQQSDFEKRHLGDESYFGVKMCSTNRAIIITAILDAASYESESTLK
jgi:hypothetical protein